MPLTMLIRAVWLTISPGSFAVPSLGLLGIETSLIGSENISCFIVFFQKKSRRSGLLKNAPQEVKPKLQENLRELEQAARLISNEQPGAVLRLSSVLTFAQTLMTREEFVSLKDAVKTCIGENKWSDALTKAGEEIAS